MPQEIINKAGLVTSIQPSRIEAVDISSTDATFDEARLLYVGVSGDVIVSGATSGTDVTFKAVPVGFFPILVTKVKKTGTTATNMVSLY